MRKKSVAATLLVLFSTLVFSAVGVCFSVYVYEDTKISVENIRVSAVGLTVYSDKKLTKTAASLNLSNMDIGLKPATGEVDEETQIPSTITDEGTSEGYYASVYVPSGVKFTIKVTNITIETNKNQVEAEEERKNIYISIKGVANSTKTLEKDEVEVASFEAGEEAYKITFLIWLGALSGEELEGSKISFKLLFSAD